MKHVRLSALMLAVSLLAMTACGGSDQAPDPTPSTAPVISASPAESTAVPAAAEETVPETSKEGRVGVEVTERSEIYTDDDSGVTLLDFRSELPVVTLEGRSSMVGALIDRFGKDISIIPRGEERFTAAVEVSLSPHFIAWIIALGDGVRITGPETLVEQMRAEARRLAALYPDQAASSSMHS